MNPRKDFAVPMHERWNALGREAMNKANPFNVAYVVRYVVCFARSLPILSLLAIGLIIGRPTYAQLTYPTSPPAGADLQTFAQRGWGALSGFVAETFSDCTCNTGYTIGPRGTCVPRSDWEQFLTIASNWIHIEYGMAGLLCNIEYDNSTSYSISNVGSGCFGGAPVGELGGSTLNSGLTQLKFADPNVIGNSCLFAPSTPNGGMCTGGIGQSDAVRVTWTLPGETPPCVAGTVGCCPKLVRDVKLIQEKNGPFPCVGSMPIRDSNTPRFGLNRICSAPAQQLLSAAAFLGRQPTQCAGDPVDLETGAFVDRLHCGAFDNPGPDLDSSLSFSSRRPGGYASVPLPAGWAAAYSRTALRKPASGSQKELIVVFTDGGDVLRFVRRDVFEPGTTYYFYTQDGDRLADGYMSVNTTTGKMYLTYRDGSTDTFTSRGDLEQVKDPTGNNAINITMTASGSDWVRKLSHSSSGQAIEQVFSRITPTGAPAAGWYLTQVRDAAQNIVGVNGAVVRSARLTYAWATAANLAYVSSYTDYAGRTVRYGNPDGAGRVQRRCDENNSGASTDNTGCVTHSYDSKGRVTRQIQPDLSVIDFTWQPIPNEPGGTGYSLEVGWKAGVGSSNTRFRRYLHDNSERIVRTYAPDKTNIYSERRYALDNGDRLESVRNELGVTTRFTYDAQGRLTETDEGVFVASQPGQQSELKLTRFADFDSFGQPRTIIDAEGRITRRTFDAATGALTSETVNDGTQNLTTTFSYTSNGQLSKVVLPDGTRHTYTYDARKYLDRITLDANDTNITGRTQLIEDYNFDWRGFLTSSTDRRGVMRTYSYDAVGRLQSEQVPAIGWSMSFQYENAGGLSQINATDGIWRFANRATSVGYQVSQITEPNGLVTTFTYDAVGRLRSSAMVGLNGTGSIASGGDANRDTLISYSTLSDGYRVTTTLEDAAQSWVDYGFDGRVIRTRDARNVTNALTYDSLGRLKTLTAGTTTAQGFIPSSFPAINAVTSYQYDRTGLVTRVTDPEQQGLAANLKAYTSYTYDGIGRPKLVTDAMGRTTQFSYDTNNRTTTIVQGSGTESKTVRLTYDRLGRLISEATDPAGLNLVVRWGYTPSIGTTNRWDVAQVTNAAGFSTFYGYDGGGRLSQTRDAKNNNWGFTRTPRGCLATQRSPLGREVRYTYGPNCQVATIADLETGINESFSYNLDGSLRVHNLGNAQHAYGYDRRGLMTSLVSTAPDAPAVSSYYQYYPNGLMYRAVSNNVDEMLPLDAMNRLASGALNKRGQLLSIGAVPTTYTYDNAGLLATTTFNGQISRYQWTADGLLKSINRDGTAIDEAYSYDSARRLLGISPNFDGSMVGQQHTLGLDARGLATTQRLPNSVSRTTTYDERGMAQHTGASGSLSEQLGPFDADGNPTSAQFFNYAPNTAGLSSQKATVFTYDARGNLKTAAEANGANAFTFTYDARDRLISYTAPAGRYPGAGYRGTTRSFTYSPMGALSKVSNPSAGVTRLTPSYQFAHHQVMKSTTWNVGETAQLGSVDYSYDVTGLGMYARSASDTVPAVSNMNVVPVQDMRGSVWFERGTTAAADASTSLQKPIYAMSGELGGLPALATDDATLGNGAHRFTGEWQTPHGLTYLRARWYFPQIGRFLQRDSYVGDPMRPASLNRHSYAEGDPINNVDPSGYAVNFLAVAAVAVGLYVVDELLAGEPTGVQTIDPNSTGLECASLKSWRNWQNTYAAISLLSPDVQDVPRLGRSLTRRGGVLRRPRSPASITPYTGSGTLRDPEIIPPNVELLPMRSAASPFELASVPPSLTTQSQPPVVLAGPGTTILTGCHGTVCVVGPGQTLEIFDASIRNIIISGGNDVRISASEVRNLSTSRIVDSGQIFVPAHSAGPINITIQNSSVVNLGGSDGVHHIGPTQFLIRDSSIFNLSGSGTIFDNYARH